jgi:hypothetical protein
VEGRRDGETTPADEGPIPDGERTGGRWYSSASFWTGPFTIGLGLLVAIGLAITWYILGGFPRDHDKYGRVSVPGQRVLRLPAGEVRINFENDTTGGGDTKSIQDQPAGLAVRVSPAAGGKQIEVEDVPSWLFSSIRNDRGHEPFAKAEIPSAGSYRVQVTDEQAGGFDSAAARRSAPGTGSGPEITLGQRPWSPFDSDLAGAIVAGLVVFIAVLLLTLPFRLIR